EDAYFTIQGFGGHFTNSQGEVVISIMPGTYNYSVTKTGFEPLTSIVVITDDAEQNLDIILTYLRYDVVVNINIDDAGTVTGAGEYYYGETASLEALPNTGYHFVHWTENQVIVSDESVYTFNVMSNRELLAVFALNTYTISATAGPNGGINPSGEVEVSHGDDITFDITPVPGYHIDDVLVNGESVGAVATYTFENVSEDGNTIHADFAINIYQVTVTSEGNGTITPDGVIDAPHGSSLVFDLVPASGHQVANIQVNGQSVGAHENYVLANITGNMTVHAVFEPVVSVDLIDPLADLKVYPNPATSQVTIESSEIITEVRLLNITGQLIKSSIFNDFSGKLDVGILYTGIYILQIRSESGVRAVTLKVK
ncbi:MAG: T9SS C-terminal target domain-containing protein, partial [Bacteroidetes bacterium]